MQARHVVQVVDVSYIIYAEYNIDLTHILGAQKTTEFSIFTRFPEFEDGTKTLKEVYEWKNKLLYKTNRLVRNDWELLEVLSESKDVITFLIETLNEDIQNIDPFFNVIYSMRLWRFTKFNPRG